MKRLLKLLLVEDSEIDATLVLRSLEKSGYEVTSLRVDTAEEMRTALQQNSWDIVISDYVMPQFSGLAALEVLKENKLDLPFIIVSGHIGEEIAVASMKAGAHDYVMKDNLARLAPAIDRELRDAEVRRQRRESETALRESEERFRQLADHIDVVFFLSEELQAGAIGRISYVSPAYAKIFGCSCQALHHDPLDWLGIVHPDDKPRITKVLPSMSKGEFNDVFRIIRTDGLLRWIQYRTYPVRNDAGTIYRIAGVAEDITERIEAQEKLENNAHQLQKTVEELKTKEEQLRATNDELSQARGLLERRVAERTAALREANNQLRRQMNERKRLENELLEIAEKERRRIGIDLHDELGQHLNGIALMLKGLELKLEKRGLPEAAESAKIQGLIFKTIQQAKAVARDLASADADTEDLTSALQAVVTQARNMFSTSCELSISDSIPPVPQPMVRQLYKITQEAITNAMKHGKAQQVTVNLRAKPQQLVLSIRNDGVPFPTKRIQGTGMGLRIMEYRASVIGGTVTIGPRPDGEGTSVVCTFPISAETVSNPVPAEQVETT